MFCSELFTFSLKATLGLLGLSSSDNCNDCDDCYISGEFEHESYWGSGPVFATCDGGAFTVSSEGGEVFITYHHYFISQADNQTDIGVSYPDLGCRAQPVDSALPMDQSSGCGPDGIGHLDSA